MTPRRVIAPGTSTRHRSPCRAGKCEALFSLFNVKLTSFSNMPNSINATQFSEVRAQRATQARAVRWTSPKSTSSNATNGGSVPRLTMAVRAPNTSKSFSNTRTALRLTSAEGETSSVVMAGKRPHLIASTRLQYSVARRSKIMLKSVEKSNHTNQQESETATITNSSTQIKKEF